MNANRMTVLGRHCLTLRLSMAAMITIAALPIPAQEPSIAKPQEFRVTRLQLPDAKGVVALDYFAYDHRHVRVWVPASNLGVVAVIDAATDKVTTVGGFQTGEVELLGKKRLLGPTSVSIGEGVVYIGNRGDSSICVVDAENLTLLQCLRIGDPAAGLAAAPDAVVYVATTKELWVTTGAPPLGIAAADNALLIMDAADPKHIKTKRRLALGASAEGYAVEKKCGGFSLRTWRNVGRRSRSMCGERRSYRAGVPGAPSPTVSRWTRHAGSSSLPAPIGLSPWMWLATRCLDQLPQATDSIISTTRRLTRNSMRRLLSRGHSLLRRWTTAAR